MAHKKPVFVVLANCPIRIVHEAETRVACERWAAKNRGQYRAMGSSLAVVKDEPLVRRTK